MRPYTTTTLRFAAAGYLVLAIYRLLSLGLARPWGPGVYAYPLGSFFGDVSLVLAMAAIFGGAAAGARSLAGRELRAPVLAVAVAAMLGYGLLDPAFQHLVAVVLLGSEPLGGPEFPWTSWRLAAELTAGRGPSGGSGGDLWSRNLLVLDGAAPLWIFGLGVLHGTIGYYAGRFRGHLSLQVRTWLLLLVSGGGFLAGLDLAARLARSASAPLPMLALLPLVVPTAVLVTLIAARVAEDP